MDNMPELLSNATPELRAQMFRWMESLQLQSRKSSYANEFLNDFNPSIATSSIASPPISSPPMSTLSITTEKELEMEPRRRQVSFNPVNPMFSADNEGGKKMSPMGKKEVCGKVVGPMVKPSLKPSLSLPKVTVEPPKIVVEEPKPTTAAAPAAATTPATTTTSPPTTTATITKPYSL